MRTTKRLPSIEGLKKVRKWLKDNYTKPPTDALVDVISKVGKNTDTGKHKPKNDIAANSPLNEVDL